MSEPPTPRQRGDRTGDRLTENDKAILLRITSGDLAEELAAEIADDLAADLVLGGPGLIP